MGDTELRRHVRKLLHWGDAHVTFDAAVKGLPARLRGRVPDGFPHSAWQLVEHMRLAQSDILEFCVSPEYRHKKFPDAYWPKSLGPVSARAWTKSLTAFRADRLSLQRLAADRSLDLFTAISWGDGQTYLRELLLAADHAAYHVGQLVLVRRALGVWRP